MRTTISLEDEVFEQVRHYAESRSLGLGKAISELIQRGFSQQRRTRKVDGLTVAVLPPDSPRITAKHVQDLESEL